MSTSTTFRNLQDRVLDVLGKSDNTTRNRVINWINLGQNDFVTRELWPFREYTYSLSTVAGTQEYSLTSNFTTLDSQNLVSVALQGTVAKKLPFIPFTRLRVSQPDFDLNATDVPQKYYLRSGNLGFWPSPAGVYTCLVDGYLLPTEMSADADVTIIPLSYREALVHYALSLEYDYNGDPDLAVKASNRYEEIVTLARNNLLAQPSDSEAFRIMGPADFKNHTDIGS